MWIAKKIALHYEDFLLIAVSAAMVSFLTKKKAVAVQETYEE
jgi:hypothetical protein